METGVRNRRNSGVQRGARGDEGRGIARQDAVDVGRARLLEVAPLAGVEVEGLVVALLLGALGGQQPARVVAAERGVEEARDERHDLADHTPFRRQDLRAGAAAQGQAGSGSAWPYMQRWFRPRSDGGRRRHGQEA